MLSEEDTKVTDALIKLRDSVHNRYRNADDSSLGRKVDEFLASLGADSPINSSNTEFHHTSIETLNYWSNNPTTAYGGNSMALLRRFEVIEILENELVIRVHFLNQPAVVLRIRELDETGWPYSAQWILPREGNALHLSPAGDGSFQLCSDLKIPPPPGATFALMKFIDSIITEWEGDETPDPENPIYWNFEEEASDPIDSLIAYKHASANTVEAIHYVVNPCKPRYRAVWADGDWMVSPDLSSSGGNKEVTIARQNAEVFLKLYSNHQSIPFELAIIASLDPDGGFFRGDFSEDMRAWISNIEATSNARNPRSQSSGPELTIIESFLEGTAELGGDFLFEAIVDIWEGIQ